MKTNEANIDIIRKKGLLQSISVIMPIWDKIGEDDFLSIDIPLLGLKTFAKDESDIEKATIEAITVFCINAEKFGKGLETELKLFGWSFKDNKKEKTSMVFNVPSKSTVLGQVIQTGEQFAAKELEITPC